MKKRISLALALLMLLCLLGGCGCRHTWTDADCLTPKTCTECGEIEGEALDHAWAEATCDTPKTCERCALRQGEPLGHNWLDATTEAPPNLHRLFLHRGRTDHHRPPLYHCRHAASVWPVGIPVVDTRKRNCSHNAGR